MALNHKLTNTIQGRQVRATSNSEGKLLITFDDGSVMTVKTAGSRNSASTGGAVKAVLQQGTTLTLEFDDGSRWEITTAEETSSVMLRNNEGKMEYAD